MTIKITTGVDPTGRHFLATATGGEAAKNVRGIFNELQLATEYKQLPTMLVQLLP